ncbi:hypothetical protein [Chryseobacterium sp.]|uniref:hypothetical protein n=1 Tax=Chryseobacterium sp. TaxID=1871047 RepID=UPI0025C2784C|nr:hypothetical protein [Chryseobacterium sp.]MBV8326116.1 hypothetical protein [Chryseobacterium sp.]
MDIKYTSINDVYGNYVFNFKDSTDGIKKINDFAEKDIQDSKKVSDSINSHIASLQKEVAEKYLKGQSLPTSATNVIFYKAPGDISGEPKTNDILIEYELDEDNFKIKKLNIPNTKTKGEISATTARKTPQSGMITISGSTITLQALKSVIRQINEAGYQLHSDQYTYSINGDKGQQLMAVLYEQKGKYLRLSFNKK